MPGTAEDILAHAVELYSPQQVKAALGRMAGEITAQLSGRNPLVLCVMKGAVVFAGQLLPLLRFPLDFDYIHVTRYRDQTQGGELDWHFFPKDVVAGRQVLVLDDILDEGHTLAAIRARCLDEGALGFHSAVLLEKLIDKPKPIAADFVGIQVPNHYVFGCGMDINGLWRNLPGIYALSEK
jgi:hypoxanthine phosphoribosyltransferase